jgi:hypothetical protein
MRDLAQLVDEMEFVSTEEAERRALRSKDTKGTKAAKVQEAPIGDAHASNVKPKKDSENTKSRTGFWSRSKSSKPRADKLKGVVEIEVEETPHTDLLAALRYFQDNAAKISLVDLHIGLSDVPSQNYPGDLAEDRERFKTHVFPHFEVYVQNHEPHAFAFWCAGARLYRELQKGQDEIDHGVIKKELDEVRKGANGILLDHGERKAFQAALGKLDLSTPKGRASFGVALEAVLKIVGKQLDGNHWNTFVNESLRSEEPKT